MSNDKLIKYLSYTGCGHADELGYIFKIQELFVPPKGSSAYNTIKRATRILSNFCTFGNPSTDFTSNWLPLQKNDTHVLDFGQEVTFKRIPEEGRLRLWQKILKFDRRNAKLTYLKVI